MILAHALGVGGFHAEFLLMGAAVAIVGIWMLRSGADVRGGRVMIGIGVVLGILSLVLG
jgi:hypothetical protein